MRGLFHIHTKYSPDSDIKPESIVEFAVGNSIGCVFVTDHETLRGVREVEKYAKKQKKPVRIVKGEEIRTNVGDIIGIFLKKEISASRIDRVIDEIKSQNGMICLPHPYKGHDTKKLKLLDGIDFVEVWNGRTSKEEDSKAEQLAKELNAKRIAGNDAHVLSELDNCFLEFNNISSFKSGEIDMEIISKTTEYDMLKSKIIKDISKRDFLAILNHIFGFFVKTIKEDLHV